MHTLAVVTALIPCTGISAILYLIDTASREPVHGAIVHFSATPGMAVIGPRLSRLTRLAASRTASELPSHGATRT